MKTFLLFLCLALAGCVEDKPANPLLIRRAYTVTVPTGRSYKYWPHVENFTVANGSELKFWYGEKLVLVAGPWVLEEE